jgi:EAL domain-containing protein (putative c-di-GMP-specific phosphodiesterase class I)
MVNVAMDMGLTVSADGVESGPQADALLALGCSRHQGHLYSPAVTAWAIEDLVVAHSVDSTLHEFMS